MRIALDAMGGDNAPRSTVGGAIDYLNTYGEDAADVILVGREDSIKPLLKNNSFPAEKLTVIHAPDLVTMDDKPAKVLRTKPNSSLVMAIQLLKSKEAEAVISAGNTGALLATSLFSLGMIKGIKRPAFAPHIPGPEGGFILCDVGANADAKPQNLVQFGIMASAYLEHLDGNDNPTVGLLNIGIEENKGNELTLAAYPLMKEHLPNFIGNIEARYILDGQVDVVVCDGFVGNTVLKFIEGVTSNMKQWLINTIKTQPNAAELSNLMQPIFSEMTKQLDYEEFGGTHLLGISAHVLKAHGDSTPRSISRTLYTAQKAYHENLIQDITRRIALHTIED
ncbi:MAG: phosphate acyltransferase PlsX [FCB group bacterium]|nr:phosphate acyltransferase PlsX [FCB group bacterium]